MFTVLLFWLLPVGRGLSGTLIWGLDECSFDFVSPALGRKISFKAWWRVRRSGVLSSQLEANGFGFDYAVFDSLQWVVVEQRRLQRSGSPRIAHMGKVGSE